MAASGSIRTIVIGGGQSGLAAAFYLSRTSGDFLVLDAHPRLGEAWRLRWDSLRLFTPAKFNSLPGMPFPGAEFSFPTKDEAGAYLQDYQTRFQLPVLLNSKVESLTKTNGRFTVVGGGQTFTAQNVIVATGPYQMPHVPPFARELEPRIFQVHSNSYRNPAQLPDGDILVVGAGNSGAEIAIELAQAGRRVWLAGRNVGRIPANELGRLFGGRPYWSFISRVLSIDTPIGRKVRDKALRQGTPLIRLKPDEITSVGVSRCARVAGVNAGRPVLNDGKVLDVAGVVWATGFRSDYGWIRMPVFDERGYPLHFRGAIPQVPGLYFVGLHFQTALTSALLGGVSRDARYVTEHMRSRGEV